VETDAGNRAVLLDRSTIADLLKRDLNESRTDPEARSYRRSRSELPRLSYLGHVVMENRHGMIVAGSVTQVSTPCRAESGHQSVRPGEADGAATGLETRPYDSGCGPGISRARLCRKHAATRYRAASAGLEESAAARLDRGGLASDQAISPQPQNACFKEATFTQAASFLDTRFLGTARGESTRFLDSADFRGALAGGSSSVTNGCTGPRRPGSWNCQEEIQLHTKDIYYCGVRLVLS